MAQPASVRRPCRRRRGGCVRAGFVWGPPPPPPSGPPLGFRMDLKLPFALTTDYSGTNGGVFQTTLAGAPQLVFGFQYGRLGVGAGLGFARVGQTNVEILNPGNPGLPGGVTNSSSSSGEVLI